MAVSLAEKYSKDPRAALREVGLLSSLDPETLALLEREGERVHLLPGDRLSPKVRSASEERYYFVIEGQIGASNNFSNRAPPKIEVKLQGGQSPDAHPYQAFFEAGDFFSDQYLQPGAAPVDCVAIMETLLAAVPAGLLQRLMKHHPKLAALLREKNEALQRRFTQNEKPSLRVIQDFYLHQNYSFANTLKVIDTEACIGCDGCERACATRHGVPRLVRKGPSLGLLSFPISCRTCADHRCLPACGFDALTLTQSELRINKDKCVGCHACYEACPNSVITMHETPYTLDDFKKPMPDTDLRGLTNVEGLYLVGEASGAALIKVAINGGVTAVNAVAESMSPSQDLDDGIWDVLIVGAGPAGLSASLQCMELGFSFRVFDKGDFAKTINTYPRNKVVMAEPAHIPKYGDLWLENTTKEQLIGKWKDIIEKTGLSINSFETVDSVKKGEDGLFDVQTTKEKVGPQRYRARRVIMATGNRGSPRKLGVQGEREPRVQYELTDPAPYKGRHVLVVGGGDSAVEGAMTLCDFGAHVTLSYRRDKFGRIKGGNKTKLSEYEAAGKVKVLMESNVRGLTEKTVRLDVKGEEVELRNDLVFAMLGAEPPIKFFKSAGINILEPGSEGMAALAKSRGTRFYANKCDHCAGHEDQACITACPTGAILELGPQEVFLKPAGAEGDMRFNEAPFVNGLDEHVGSKRFRRLAGAAAVLSIIVAVLIGVECFLRMLLPDLSLLSAWHRFGGVEAEVFFKPGHGLGFYLGITGTALMFITALYPLNSRLGFLRKLAKTKFWLLAHIVAGLLGPALVSYHTTLKLDRWPAVAFWAMWAVVFSGVLGRYIFTWVRRSVGLAALEGQALQSTQEEMIGKVESGKGKTQFIKLDEMMDAHLEPANPILLPALLLWHSIKTRSVAWKMRLFDLRVVSDKALRGQAVDVFLRRARNERRKLFWQGAEKSALMWRRIHLLATVLLFGVATLHIVIALLYRGI